MMTIGRRGVLLGGATAAASAAAARNAGPGRSPLLGAPLLAERPPMGWNSWNSFATTITEAQALETAGIMAEKLRPFGYDVFTIDIQWYEPHASSYDYSASPVPTMDEYGRLLPAPNRFPSAADGTASRRSRRGHPARPRQRALPGRLDVIAQRATSVRPAESQDGRAS